MSHLAGDGSFGNLKTEHAEFGVNTRSTSGYVLRKHLKNQLVELCRNSVSATNSHSRFAEDGPIQPESSHFQVEIQFDLREGFAPLVVGIV
jgi:hypothetical protein